MLGLIFRVGLILGKSRDIKIILKKAPAQEQRSLNFTSHEPFFQEASRE